MIISTVIKLLEDAIIYNDSDAADIAVACIDKIKDGVPLLIREELDNIIICINNNMDEALDRLEILKSDMEEI